MLQLKEHIDLIIPRGSAKFVSQIQESSRRIPVLGHSEGVCHVYVDQDASEEMTLRIVQDSKCGYPSACNAMETLLFHSTLVDTPIFTNTMRMLVENGVLALLIPVSSITASVPPPMYRSIYPFIHPSVRLFICSSIHPSVCPSTHPSVHLFVCLSTIHSCKHPPISACSSIHLSFYPSIHLSVCLSVHSE